MGFPYLDRYGHQVKARGPCHGGVLRAADSSGSTAAAVGVAQVVGLAVLRRSHHVIVAPGGSLKKFKISGTNKRAPRQTTQIIINEWKASDVFEVEEIGALQPI